MICPALLVLASLALRADAVPSVFEEDCHTAASAFKVPNNSTPPHKATRWSDEDSALHLYISRSVPAVLEHTGFAAFDEHLQGVQAVLRGWNSPDYLTKAGLFHSIYGTEGFQGFALPLSERGGVQSLIGENAERLSWIFCMADRTDVDQSALTWTPTSCSSDRRYVFRSRPELGRFELVLDRDEWLDFIELTLADWLEQVEGAASKPSDLFLWQTGEAFAYRRDAYSSMARILAAERPDRLGGVVPRMFREVMATEPEGTRNLVQPRTPPMSDAAERALEALRAAGEDIPLDLRPQPQ